MQSGFESIISPAMPFPSHVYALVQWRRIVNLGERVFALTELDWIW